MQKEEPIECSELSIMLALRGQTYNEQLKTLESNKTQIITTSILQQCFKNDTSGITVINLLNKKFGSQITVEERVTLLTQYLSWCLNNETDPDISIAHWSASLSLEQKIEIFKHLPKLYRNKEKLTSTALLIISKAIPFDLYNTPKLINVLEMDNNNIHKILTENDKIRTAILTCAKREENSAYLYNITIQVEDIFKSKLKSNIESMNFGEIIRTLLALTHNSIESTRKYLLEIIEPNKYIQQFHDYLKTVPHKNEQLDYWLGFECIASLAQIGVLTETELEKAYDFTLLMDANSPQTNPYGHSLRLSEPSILMKYINENIETREQILIKLLRSMVYTFKNNQCNYSSFYNYLSNSIVEKTSPKIKDWVGLLATVDNSRCTRPIHNLDTYLKNLAIDKTIQEIKPNTVTAYDTINKLGILNKVTTIYTVLSLANEKVSFQDILQQLIKSEHPINQQHCELPELDII